MRNGRAALPSGANATSQERGCRTGSSTAIVVGPMPKRRETRMAVNAATSEPAAPMENTTPITPGESPSSRTAKTR